MKELDRISNKRLGKRCYALGPLMWVLAGVSWPLITAVGSEGPGRHELNTPVCQESRIRPDAYQLVSTSQGYFLREGQETTAPFLFIPREWLVPTGVQEEEDTDYVTSLNWSESVTAFSVSNKGTIGLHLSSYDLQREGSAQMTVGRDVFLVLDLDGKLYPGLIDLGITQKRGRVHGQWFARSHRFIKADVNGDDLQDLGVVVEEIPIKLNAEGTPEAVAPTLLQPSIQWYVYQPSISRWVHKLKFDGQLEAGGYQTMLPLVSMAMTSVEFVKRIYYLK